MLIKNDMEDRTLVNGSQGFVTRFDKASRMPYVKFHGARREKLIRDATWNHENAQGVVLASRTIVPLRLAAAISIHKSQGMTLNKVEVHGDKVFACGHFYVAISRATSLSGLRVASYNLSKIRADPRVLAFHDKIRSVSSLMQGDSTFPL